MSRNMLLGLLRTGNTGNEILAILDTIVGGDAPAEVATVTESAAVSYGEPTTEWVEF